MWFKNKLQTLYHIFERHFLMPFCLLVFSIAIFITTVKLNINFLTPNTAVYTGLVFGFISFFVWIKRLDQETNFFIHIRRILSSLFLTSLFILTASNLDDVIPLKLPLSETHKTMMILITVLTGFIIFNLKNEEKTIDSKTPNLKLDGWFVVAFLSFLVVKIYVILTHNGTFADESFGIFSAASLAESAHFPQIYEGVLYLRGSYASVISAIVFYIFGVKVLYLKFLFAFISLINFFLFYKISEYFFKERYYIYLVLLAYTICPWVIFADFYIRFYLFYELFILLISYLSLRIVKAENEKNYKDSNKNLFLFFAINIFIFLFSFDAGRLMLGLFSSLIFSYIYIYVIQRKENPSAPFFERVLVFERKIKLYAILCIYTIIISCMVILITTKVIDVTNIIYSSTLDLKYDHLFFGTNLISSIFFLLAIVPLINSKNKTDPRFSIIFAAEILFVVNLLLPLNLQNTRSILYFFPLYYLIIFGGISYFTDSTKVKLGLKIIIPLIIYLDIFTGYPRDFIKTPHIPKEVDYIDNSIYEDAKKQCSNNLIIVSSNPGVAIINEIKPSYYINTKYSDPAWVTSSSDSSLAYLKGQTYYDTYSNVELITTLDQLKQISSQNKNMCIIHGGLPYSWLNEEVRLFIKNNFSNSNKKYLTNEDYKRMILYIKN